MLGDPKAGASHEEENETADNVGANDSDKTQKLAKAGEDIDPNEGQE